MGAQAQASASAFAISVLDRHESELVEAALALVSARAPDSM